MAEIIDQKIGSGGEVKAEFKGGSLVLSASYNEGAVGSSLSISLSSDVLIDQIEAKVPNVLAKEVLEILKTALKSV